LLLRRPRQQHTQIGWRQLFVKLCCDCGCL
jgi:hypothetical protein